MSTIPTFKNAVWTGLDIAIRGGIQKGWVQKKDEKRAKEEREIDENRRRESKS